MLRSVLIGGGSAGQRLAGLLAARQTVSLLDDDLLSGVPDALPAGEVYLLLATGDPEPRWAWTLPLDVLVTTARLAPLLEGRDITVVSCLNDRPASPLWSVEVSDWLVHLAAACTQPCPPWRVARLCRDFLTLAASRLDQADPLALARLVHQTQHIIVHRAAGAGHVRMVTLDALLATPDGTTMAQDHGEQMAEQIPVVVPSRLAFPDLVADRQQQAIWTGQVKHGNRWSRQLAEQLRPALGLAPGDELLITRSGTDALRLAIAGITGRAQPGDIAVLPSFTFRATADVLIQLGYQVRYVDVDPWSWTLDPSALHVALADERIRLVVCVDTFGNPCAYGPLQALCARRQVPLIADSAASIGSAYHGVPIGTQASAHAFSMSFAKVMTSAGAGGALVFPRGSRRHDLTAWLGSALMDELHAIAALDQLALLPDLVRRRGDVARAYQRAAQDQRGFVTQGVARGNLHSYVHWVAQVPDRARFSAELAALGVQTKPYYEAQHLHHELASQCVALPVTERLDREALALPMSSELSRRQTQRLGAAFTVAAQRLSESAEFAVCEGAR